MTTKQELINEKLDQAVEILHELDIDVWVTFARESILNPDPALDLILGFEIVWQSAFIITKDNRRFAIVGKHDVENIYNIGGYTDVIPYLEGIRAPLADTLMTLDPRQIALNYSENDVAADGLSHGLMLLLQRYLADSEMTDRFVSAERIISALRGRKSPSEVARIKQAIQTTQGIFEQAEGYMKPGRSELDVANFVHGLVDEKRLGTAWDYDYCPTVSAGPDSPVGHAGPQDKYKIAPGQIIHMDFGVKENEYCADLQRIWYFRKEGETDAPAEVQKGFEAARKALMAGFEMLKPGVQGWQVDEAARNEMVAQGYPEYEYAYGHLLGRVAHDGSTTLGPRWERYGQTPYNAVEAGNVFAIELGLAVPGYGYVGLEENVIVTENGAEWLSDPQESVWLI